MNTPTFVPILLASRDPRFIGFMRQVLAPAGIVYVATCEAEIRRLEAEIRRLEAEGVVFGAWVVDPMLEDEAAWMA